MGKHQSKLNPDVLEDLRSITQFNDAEIIGWHEGFHKDCPTGLLNMEGFKTMYGNFFPYGNASAFSEHVFRTFDTNGDRCIDFREFLFALSLSSNGNIEEKLKWAFNMYDLDKDGFITREEMVEIVTSIYQIEGVVLKVPEDEDTPERRMEKIFGQMDGGRNGRLSLEEFVEDGRNDPTVCNLFQVVRSISFIYHCRHG